MTRPQGSEAATTRTWPYSPRRSLVSAGKLFSPAAYAVGFAGLVVASLVWVTPVDVVSGPGIDASPESSQVTSALVSSPAPVAIVDPPDAALKIQRQTGQGVPRLSLPDPFLAAVTHDAGTAGLNVDDTTAVNADATLICSLLRRDTSRADVVAFLARQNPQLTRSFVSALVTDAQTYRCPTQIKGE